MSAEPKKILRDVVLKVTKVYLDLLGNSEYLMQLVDFVTERDDKGRWVGEDWEMKYPENMDGAENAMAPTFDIKKRGAKIICTPIKMQWKLNEFAALNPKTKEIINIAAKNLAVAVRIVEASRVMTQLIETYNPRAFATEKDDMEFDPNAVFQKRAINAASMQGVAAFKHAYEWDELQDVAAKIFPEKPKSYYGLITPITEITIPIKQTTNTIDLFEQYMEIIFTNALLQNRNIYSIPALYASNKNMKMNSKLRNVGVAQFIVDGSSNQTVELRIPDFKGGATQIDVNVASDAAGAGRRTGEVGTLFVDLTLSGFAQIFLFHPKPLMGGRLDLAPDKVSTVQENGQETTLFHTLFGAGVYNPENVAVIPNRILRSVEIGKNATSGQVINATSLVTAEGLAIDEDSDLLARLDKHGFVLVWGLPKLEATMDGVYDLNNLIDEKNKTKLETGFNYDGADMRFIGLSMPYSVSDGNGGHSIHLGVGPLQRFIGGQKMLAEVPLGIRQSPDYKKTKHLLQNAIKAETKVYGYVAAP